MSSDSNLSLKESLDGLPKQFVSSLRILFDILDETRSGFVRLVDIESRWSDDGVKGLPAGVVDGLRKVTPPNGLLSFERFVAGLKLVLKKKNDDVEMRRPFVPKENRTPLQEYNLGKGSQFRDVNSNKFASDARLAAKQPQNINSREYDSVQQHPSYRQPYSSQTSIKHTDHRHYSDSHYDAQHVHERHRRSSPVQMSKSVSMPRDVTYNNYVIKPDVSSYGSHHAPVNNAGNFRHGLGSNQLQRPQERDRPPVVPPRTDRSARATSPTPQMKKSLSGPNLASQSNAPPAVPPREQQSTRIVNDLKNWQREWTANQTTDNRYGAEKISQPPKKSNPDSEIYANIEQFQRRKEGDKKQPQLTGPQKASVQRHGSGRRHTLANGIDQNMMKRMKQLEEETSMLRSGLAMVESARDWYLKQLASVSDKQAMLGKVTYNDNSVEAHQERMNFQRARIAEINQHLQTLLESSEKGFPIHMNLAMPATGNKSADNIAVQNLKEQNRRLLEEMSQKKDQISQLEKEKASLVRDLFEARSKNKSNYDDTTFM